MSRHSCRNSDVIFPDNFVSIVFHFYRSSSSNRLRTDLPVIFSFVHRSDETRGTGLFRFQRTKKNDH